MKYITILLLLMSFTIAQEAKIDSVAIQTELTKLNIEYNKAVNQITTLEKHKENIAYAYNVLAKMLVPKVEPVIEEDNE